MAGTPNRRAAREAELEVRRVEREARVRSAWEEFLGEYWDDPVGFVRAVWGEYFRIRGKDGPYDYQCRIMEDVADPECRQVGVKSGHGVGKTAVAAWLIIWFMVSRYPGKVLVTSATAGQLFDALHPEVKFWVNESEILRDLLEVKAEKIELVGKPEAMFATFKTSRADAPDALQGKHSPNTLIVIDEGAAVPEAVYEAASSSMSDENATTLMMGNPTQDDGFFWEAWNEVPEMWRLHTINAEDSPNVNPAFCEEKAKKYGRDSNEYRIRVRGEFPLGAEDGLIPAVWIQEAFGRDVRALPGASEVWSVDPSGGGQNKSIFTRRAGPECMESTEVPHGPDLMELVGWVKARWDGVLPSERPVAVVVDAGGLGAGVAYRLRELGLPVIALNVQSTPQYQGGEDDVEYSNLGAELYFALRSWFESRVCSLPGDLDKDVRAEFLRHLKQPKIIRRGAKVDVDKYGRGVDGSGKKKGRKDRRKSPDRADGLMLTFAVEPAVALGVAPSSWSRSEDPVLTHTVWS